MGTALTCIKVHVDLEAKMQIGKVPENVLKRSILKLIKTRREEVKLGASVGEDCAAIELAPDEMMVMSTDPITGTTNDIGTLAIQITVNDLASTGAEPIGVMLTLLLPPRTREIQIKRIMEQAEVACAKANVQIMGGHTEITDVVKQPLISVTGVGKVKKGKVISTGGAKPGMDIVATKWIGLEGTSIIAKEKEEELLSHFPKHLVDEAKSFDEYISVQSEAAVAVSFGVAAMHDVTEGGILGALWEMAEASGVGLDIDFRSIPVKQETIEIAEYFGINPYKLISSGCMLIACSDGNGLVRALDAKGINATVIGKATDSNDRVLLSDGERSFMEPPKTDELYKVL